MEGLITFYSSPAGQHLLDAQPVIAQEYMPMVMGKVGQRSQAMTKEMMKEMAEVVPASKPAAAETGGKTCREDRYGKNSAEVVRVRVEQSEFQKRGGGLVCRYWIE